MTLRGYARKNTTRFHGAEVRLAETKLCPEPSPRCGVERGEASDVDGGSVVEGIVFDEGGFDAGGVFVLAVDVAALVGGQRARQQEHRHHEGDAHQGQGQGYVVARFHA